MSSESGLTIAGGFGRKSAMPTAPVTIAWLRATRARCASIASPITHLPMAARACSMQRAFRVIKTSAGGRPKRNLTNFHSAGTHLNTSNFLKLGLAVVMLGAAAFFIGRFLRQDDGVS